MSLETPGKSLVTVNCHQRSPHLIASDGGGCGAAASGTPGSRQQLGVPQCSLWERHLSDKAQVEMGDSGGTKLSNRYKGAIYWPRRSRGSASTVGKEAMAEGAGLLFGA